MVALFFFAPQSPKQRIAAVAFVACVHIAAIIALFAGIRVSRLPIQTREFSVVLLRRMETSRSVPLPALEPNLEAPQEVHLVEPPIEIMPQSVPGGISTTLSNAVLPPRPVRHHLNLPPDLPWELKRFGANAAVIIRILVTPDGTIGDAMLVQGSGNASVDKIAMAYVTATWRFLPASQGGQPVQDWITVRVRVG